MTERSLEELITLRREKREKIFRQVEELMNREKIYRDSTLTLDSLASRLNVSRNLLSEALNSDGERGFVRYVNAYRVKEVIRELVVCRYNRVKLESIYENAGFGTRSSFYQHFKEITGLTPVEFCTGKIKDND